MQANQHFDSELFRLLHTQVNEVHLNGLGNQDPPYQSEAMENVYYWYDGNVPYCADATAWQPLDDNYLHMSVPGYSYVDGYQGTPHQLVNIHHPHADHLESTSSYTLQHSGVPTLYAHDHTPMFSSPTSSSTSLSSLHWSDSEASPPPRQQHLEEATGELPSALPFSPSVPQTALPACDAQQSPEAPRSRRPSPAATPALDSTPRDIVGRRAPKQRRVTRAVQPLACFFCRGRKIACGPPATLSSGDRTCEPCARRRLVCEYPAESYRGRRTPGTKATSGRPQRR